MIVNHTDTDVNRDLFKQTLNQVLQGVDQQGYAVVPHAFDPALIEGLLLDCQARQHQFKLAAIGRQKDTKIETNIRNDKTLWFSDPSLPDPAITSVQVQFLQLLGRLKNAVNQRFFMGLFDYECHYAIYQPGGFYQKHLDAFRGRSNRLLSTVCYLNTVTQGGQLVIYAEHQPERVLVSVPAVAGTLVVFESERFAHEVLATDQVRYSIAGWFRTNNSLAGGVDPAS